MTGSPAPGSAWTGTASSTVPPPEDYWEQLSGEYPPEQVAALRQLSDLRQGELDHRALPPPEGSAAALLERLADDGWVVRERRWRCPECEEELGSDDASAPVCPHCDAELARSGGASVETAYVRHLARQRSVEWVVAIHGMNTRGAWQESFGWLVATTWGRSVPVFVYKYGKVIVGVLAALRRRALKDRFRERLVRLFDEAGSRGYRGRPDVVAHSFGTWILGHVLRDELRRAPDDRLRFGRLILTGCILRPDFEWEALRRAGIVEEVLNHFGTRDPVVPLAHLTILDSGPSGRRGFDRRGAVNVRAEGYGHSDLFRLDRCVADGRAFQPCAGGRGVDHLEHAYRSVWRPFLTFPTGELDRIPGRSDPGVAWRPLPWPLRGTLLPYLALALAAALPVLAGAALGRTLGRLAQASGALPWAVGALGVLAAVAGAGVTILLLGAAAVLAWRRLTARPGATPPPDGDPPGGRPAGGASGPPVGGPTDDGRRGAPGEDAMSPFDDDAPLVRELEREIRLRRLYAKSDFVWNHFVVLVIALASAVPAFAEIFHIDRPRMVAAVAALPALLVLLQRTFLWHERGEWHWDYRRKLVAIYRQLRDQGIDLKDASARLNALEKDLAGSFPGLRSSRADRNEQP